MVSHWHCDLLADRRGLAVHRERLHQVVGLERVLRQRPALWRNPQTSQRPNQSCDHRSGLLLRRLRQRLELLIRWR